MSIVCLLKFFHWHSCTKKDEWRAAILWHWWIVRLILHIVKTNDPSSVTYLGPGWTVVLMTDLWWFWRRRVVSWGSSQPALHGTLAWRVCWQRRIPSSLSQSATSSAISAAAGILELQFFCQIVLRRESSINIRRVGLHKISAQITSRAMCREICRIRTRCHLVLYMRSMFVWVDLSTGHRFVFVRCCNLPRWSVLYDHTTTSVFLFPIHILDFNHNTLTWMPW